MTMRCRKCKGWMKSHQGTRMEPLLVLAILLLGKRLGGQGFPAVQLHESFAEACSR